MTFPVHSLNINSTERIIELLRSLVANLRATLAECPVAYVVALYVRDPKDGSEMLFAAGYSPLIGTYMSTALNAICFSTKADAEKLIRNLKLPDNVRAEACSYSSMLNAAINQAEELAARMAATP